MLRLSVVGHASSEPIAPRNRGVFADNYALSEARARAVAAYIANALGTPAERITVTGRGADEPVASNATEAGRIRNRRAAVEIVAGGFQLCPLPGYDPAGLAAARTLAIADALARSLGTGGVCRVVPAPTPTATSAARSECPDCGGFVVETASHADLSRPDTEPEARTAILTARASTPGREPGRVWLREDPAVLERRLAVGVPAVVKLGDDGRLAAPVELTTLTNYPAFIASMEAVIYRRDDTDRVAPLATIAVPVEPHARIAWRGEQPLAAGTELVVVLRARGADGAVDEANPVGFKAVAADFGGRFEDRDVSSGDLYARPPPAQQQIVLNGSRVRVHGAEVPVGAAVAINGSAVPVDRNGAFAAEYLVPTGHHEFEVAITDSAGRSEQRLPVDVDGEYLFLAALGDLTASTTDIGGAIEPLSGDEDFADDRLVEGRVALYAKGKIKGRYLLTAQMDSGEEELSELVDRLDEKNPRTLFRHLDPDRYYPVYGDDSTTIDDTDSLGKFYVRLDWDRSQAVLGNYHTDLTDTELAQYSRSLYGAELEYQSRAINTVQEKPRASGELFASSAQTALAHDEFLGTGGSLYYLRNPDVVFGSEKVRVEVRERDSDRVLENAVLVRGVDYDVDELQGRILLAKPLSQVAFKTAPAIVRDRPLDGDRVLLLVDYEYVPTGFAADNLAAGGRGRFWVSDRVQLGTTYVNESRDAGDYGLAGVDLTLRAGEGTYLKVEGASTDASQTNVFFSDNGGLSFFSTNRIDPATGAELATPREGDAVAIEARINLREQGLTSSDWTGAAWWRETDAGFSIARRDFGLERNEHGFELAGDLGRGIGLRARASSVETVGALDSTRVSVQIEQTEGRGRFGGELRRLDENDVTAGSAYDATLAALRYTRTLAPGLDLYAVAQKTVDDDGGAYADNDLVGIGARARVADRMSVAGEIDDGDRGNAAQLSVDYRVTPERTIYGTYSQSPDRTDSLPYREQFAVGQRSAVGNQANVFAETQFVDDDTMSGLAHAFGLDFGVGDGFTFGFSTQQGELTALSGPVDRDAFGVTGAYEGERWRWRSALETRADEGAENRRQRVTSHRVDRLFDDALRLLFRLNVADTNDDLEAEQDARFVEGSIGLAHRPTDNDRFNWLGKYTYLYDLPSAAQARATAAQRSTILSFEGVYRLNERWDVGGKWAAREAEVRDSRAGGDWYSSDANLAVVRGTFHMLKRWDALLELRSLEVEAADSRREGFLFGIDRRLNEHMRVGVGYNFTDFSDDLRVLDYDRRGWFLNVVGSY